MPCFAFVFPEEKKRMKESEALGDEIVAAETPGTRKKRRATSVLTADGGTKEIEFEDEEDEDIVSIRH